MRGSRSRPAPFCLHAGRLNHVGRSPRLRFPANPLRKASPDLPVSDPRQAAAQTQSAQADLCLRSKLQSFQSLPGLTGQRPFTVSSLPQFAPSDPKAAPAVPWRNCPVVPVNPAPASLRRSQTEIQTLQISTDTDPAFVPAFHTEALRQIRHLNQTNLPIINVAPQRATSDRPAHPG